ncbi:MAG: VUT family protein [Flavobacteriales bacterium]|nr:VUT family protein [Crocinitomicaceae bacterium]NBX80346.1 VUT family protein [Flavobacteriales bacterium]
MEVEKLNERRQWLFIFLVGLFITNAVTAELISNKLIQIPIDFSIFGNKFGPFTTIVGILPWPIVFILTDLMNEFYGQKAVKRVSWITAALIAYCFIVVGVSLSIPAFEIKGSNLATNASYNQVFGQAQMVIVGSIAAFLISQLMDAYLFDWIKKKTGNRYIWLRSTGSTLFSQLVDSYVVLYIGFVLPGSLKFSDYMTIAPTNYILKMLIAVSLTPLIYLGHYGVNRYLKSH